MSSSPCQSHQLQPDGPQLSSLESVTCSPWKCLVFRSSACCCSRSSWFQNVYASAADPALLCFSSYSSGSWLCLWSHVINGMRSFLHVTQPCAVVCSVKYMAAPRCVCGVASQLVGSGSNPAWLCMCGFFWCLPHEHTSSACCDLMRVCVTAWRPRLVSS